MGNVGGHGFWDLVLLVFVDEEAGNQGEDGDDGDDDDDDDDDGDDDGDDGDDLQYDGDCTRAGAQLEVLSCSFISRAAQKFTSQPTTRIQPPPQVQQTFGKDQAQSGRNRKVSETETLKSKSRKSSKKIFPNECKNRKTFEN